jgi:N-acetylated-alpha-linked acidic dipeptidase
LGNHHDAWVYGACDPSSGTAALLEVARCLSELSKLGYKPKRSLLLAAWDGEEFGMLGSTEWVEQFKEELQKEAVAYLNVDTAVTGSDFDASSIPSLKPLIREVTKEVIDPKSGKSVYELWKQKQTKGEGRKAEGEEQKAENKIVGAQHAAPNEDVKLGNLGSGSDFAPFLSHIALPSLSFSFDGPYGVYHSLHDDFYWVEHFADPNFEYHAATAKIWGLLALRLANADLLPFDYYEYADEVSEYIGDFKSGKIAHDRKLEAGSDELTAEFGTLSFEVERLKTATRKLNEATQLMLSGDSDNQDSDKSDKDARLILKKLNDTLPQLEQKFLSAAGLPNRPWMKHLIYAPSLDSGYGSELLPGLNGALIEGNIQLAKSQIETLKNAIINLRSEVERINDELREWGMRNGE